MYGKFQEHLSKELADITAAGLYKNERLIEGPQQAAIQVQGKEVLNFCANNYLGLSNHPRLIQAAKDMMDRRGYGMSSVRFICGTQDIHKQLEAAISKFFKTEDTILYAACFDANGGVFEPLFTADDAIISDALNHASIIDGVRLCKAKRYRYANGRHGRLRALLAGSAGTAFPHHLHRRRLFDGRQRRPDRQNLRPWPKSMTPSCSSTRATRPAWSAPQDAASASSSTRTAVSTSTPARSAKPSAAPWAASPPARKEIIDLLRQRSRPYLFSNSVAPAIVGAALETFKILDESNELHDRLVRQYELLPRQDAGRRLRHETHAKRHLRRNALRRQTVAGLRQPYAGGRHLRHWLLLPCRTERAGAHPRPAVRRSYPASNSTSASPPSSRWARSWAS